MTADTRTHATSVARAEVIRLRWWLQHIRDIAACSEGVEFYAMLADMALSGRPALDPPEPQPLHPHS